MSKKMTPCEKLGYKVGDKFKVVDGTGVHYAVGSFITLIHDDGSSCPRFNGVHSIFESGDSFFPLDFVEKVAKLKPAKQALADAIHQNGGWVECGEFAAQDKDGQEGCAVWFYSGGRPYEHNDSWYPSGNGDAIYGNHISCDKPFVNWNQTVLSRDEYLTAYPEQVKVEVRNETQHKVEVEMESESEVTIKVSDWHKNGELPPVGEVCLYVVSERLSVEVEITAHARFGLCFVGVGKSGERYVSKAAELHRFRPIRAEREKEIDEMMRVAAENWGNLQDCCERLYEYGYRKEVK